MFATVNVTIGAVLSVILASTPVFSIHKPADLLQPLIFVTLIVLITGNIHATTDSLHNRLYSFFVVSILLFCFIQVFLLLSYSMEISKTSITMIFQNKEYVWLFALLTTIWFLFAIFVTLCERDWLRL